MGGGNLFSLSKRVVEYLSLFSFNHKRKCATQCREHKTSYHKGGILIEFAFSIPIAILLMLFVNDHYRFYELRNKIKSSAYLVASMIQQIGNTHNSKQLTLNDIARIAYASCLNLFHTNSMSGSHPLGIYYIVYTYYVKKLSNNSYQFQKCYFTTSPSSATTLEARINKGFNVNTTSSLASIQAINPDLVPNKDGDERVMIVCWYSKYNFTKNKLGFYLLTPNFGQPGNNYNTIGFAYRLVITPKPGLFPIKE